jgi:hypothetical protein
MKSQGHPVPIVSSTIENCATSQNLGQLTIWKPRQGSLPEAVPISIDLDFDEEHVSLPTATFSICAARATLHLKISDADVARGSRLGEFAHNQDMVAEVTQSVRSAIETDTEVGGKIDVTIQRGFLGALTALVSWKNRRSRRAENDHILKTAKRIFRVSPRPNLRWDIVEPVTPHILRGRYIGAANEQEAPALCIVTMRKKRCLVRIDLVVNRHDLQIHNLLISGSRIANKNKAVILDQLARRSIRKTQVDSIGLTTDAGENGVILCKSLMELEIADH